MFDILDEFNDTAAQNAFEPSDIQNHKVAIVLPYLIPILFFLPIIADNNSYCCKFHANQQFIWFLVLVVLSLVLKILGFIPIIGWIINLIASIAVLAIAVILMVDASAGKAIKIPFVGDLINLF